MNLARIALAALGAFVAYFVLGFLMFGLMPFLRDELRKYPAVYRNQEGQMSNMPPGMAAMFVAMLVLAVIYAMLYQGASGLAAGARFGALFGALIGVFSVCTFVIHNYVNLNIGLKLTLQQAAAYFVEWTVTGLVIGLIVPRRPTDHPVIPNRALTFLAGAPTPASVVSIFNILMRRIVDFRQLAY